MLVYSLKVLAQSKKRIRVISDVQWLIQSFHHLTHILLSLSLSRFPFFLSFFLSFALSPPRLPLWFSWCGRRIRSGRTIFPLSSHSFFLLLYFFLLLPPPLLLFLLSFFILSWFFSCYAAKQTRINPVLLARSIDRLFFLLSLFFFFSFSSLFTRQA